MRTNERGLDDCAVLIDECVQFLNLLNNWGFGTNSFDKLLITQSTFVHLPHLEIYIKNLHS